MESLKLSNTPLLNNGTMLLALSGWMDGGLVSTGTVRHLMEGRKLVPVGSIDPRGFYLDNFPGSMDIAALFRPHVKYENGLVTDFDMPENDFFADPASNLAFFIGKEPNIDWPGFANCIFEVCQKLNVKRIIFMGSFGGTVPHTREPRMYGSVSDKKLLPLLRQHELTPSDYEGPGSFATYLLTHVTQLGIDMLSIAVEIPGYLQGINPLSIEAVTRRLAAILDVPINIDKLRQASTAWELQVSDAIEKDEKLAGTVRKLEERYDNALIGVVSEDDNEEEDQEIEEEDE